MLRVCDYLCVCVLPLTSIIYVNRVGFGRACVCMMCDILLTSIRL